MQKAIKQCHGKDKENNSVDRNVDVRQPSLTARKELVVQGNQKKY